MLIHTTLLDTISFTPPPPTEDREGGLGLYSVCVCVWGEPLYLDVAKRPKFRPRNSKQTRLRVAE
jgi:hypothetical protein